MPQGKGTYGSKVGRPSKKGKYQSGGNVDPFSTRNPVGVPAEQLSEAMDNQNMANQGLPTSNAQERSQASPDVTSYKEGGKVAKIRVIDEESATYAKDRKSGRYTATKDVKVKTEKGDRWYRGKGTSKDFNYAEAMARMDAKGKVVTAPADSLVTGGKRPSEMKKKKKKWFGRKKK